MGFCECRLSKHVTSLCAAPNHLSTKIDPETADILKGGLAIAGFFRLLGHFNPSALSLSLSLSV
jgi:hypothetical protein